MQGKTVVVTGAGGSIGSEVCRRVALAGAARVVLVSLTESGLYNTERSVRALKTPCGVIPLLGSTTDWSLMMKACDDADIVIHAAAHKHVPICEANPLEAIRSNVIGTLNAVRAAGERGVGQFVLISTDKAVNPVSVMGQTKRFAEMLLRRLPYGRTDFFAVRFGNVLDSAGSVLPLWREQIANGGPVTLTHPECKRYFMSIPEAVDLIFGTLYMQPQGGIFVFDMGAPRSLLSMAYEEIRKSGKDVDISIVGLRPGERVTEELTRDDEGIELTENPNIFRVYDPRAETIPPGDIEWLESAVAIGDVDQALSIIRRVTSVAKSAA